MCVKITPHSLKGTVISPSSKSFAHRLLILASLKDGNTVLKNVGESDDVRATISCLNALGAEITVENGDAYVRGIPSLPSKSDEGFITLPVNESGSTFRFIMVLAAVLGKSVRYEAKGRLLERPSEALTSLLEKNGVQFSYRNGTLEQTGALTGDFFEIDGSLSSQYITAFLLALPFLNRKTTLNISGTLVSSDYIAITEAALKNANISYEKSLSSYSFKGNTPYALPNTLSVEGDWSSASFFLASSLLSGGTVGVSGLNLASVQGDRKVLDVFKKMGSEVIIKNDTIFISKQISLRPVEIGVDDIIDSVPILAVNASFIKGCSVFKNIKRLKFKESNRLEAIITLLKEAGINSYEKDNSLFVEGGFPHPGHLKGYKDHRIVMSAAVLSAFVEGERPSIVEDKNAVSKSYKNFWSDFKKLGGVVSDVDLER